MGATLLIVAAMYVKADNVPAEGEVKAAARTAIEMATYTNGRIRGSLVRQGMTWDEVFGILGGKCAIFLMPPMEPNGPCMWLIYPKHGLDVCLSYDKDGVTRVKFVRFWAFHLF